MTLFRKRYRIESARLIGRDYAEPGAYFVTLCTKGKQCWFGEIRSGIVGLSDVGCIVAQEIQHTSCIRSHVELDAWIVMPNHVHMIVRILPIENDDPVETARRAVSTDVAEIVSLPRLKPQSLGSIVGRIKAQATAKIRRSGFPEFAWQERFHDRIIRNDRTLQNIRTYIRNNPVRWEIDHAFTPFPPVSEARAL